MSYNNSIHFHFFNGFSQGTYVKSVNLLYGKKRYPIVQDRVIDEQQIILRRGGIYRLCGSGFAGKTMRVYAEVWTPWL